MSFLKKNTPNLGNTDSIIGDKTFFEGKIKAHNGIRIDGKIKGEIECQGVVEVGRGGKIEADIVADIVIISGEVVGNILAKDRLEITAQGRVRGDIVTAHLVIDDGVLFEGSCHMLTDGKTSYVPEKAKPSQGKNAAEKNSPGNNVPGKNLPLKVLGEEV